MADNYFEIKSLDKTSQRIYLYNHGIYSSNDKIDMVIISNENNEKFILEQEITEDFDAWYHENLCSFLFCVDNNYYYQSPTSSELEFLGKRETKTIFISGKTPKIKVLYNNRILTIEADLAMWGDVFIPPTAKKSIQAQGKHLPDNYLLTKNNNKYTVYGLYEKKPTCVAMEIPIVIFKEAGQDVVLIWEKNEYREIFRTKTNIKCSTNDVFVEIIENSTELKGIVQHLNEETKQIETLYKGKFYALDFDNGAVIGENGYEYNP